MGYKDLERHALSAWKFAELREYCYSGKMFVVKAARLMKESLTQGVAWTEIGTATYDGHRRIARPRLREYVNPDGQVTSFFPLNTSQPFHNNNK